MSFLTLVETKEFLQVDYSGQDTTVQILIDAIEEFVERHCGIGLTSVARQDVVFGGGRSLWPQTRPVTSITTLTQINDANDEEVIDTDEFRLANDKIIRDDQSRWLAGRDRYRIDYVGGFASGLVPAGLKMVILDLVFRAFHNRGGKSGESASGLAINWQDPTMSNPIRMLAPYRQHGIVG